MLQQYERDFLDANGITDVNWIINERLGEEIKTFLLTRCGFNQVDAIPSNGIMVNALQSGITTITDNDPLTFIKGYVLDAYINDSLQNAAINAYQRRDMNASGLFYVNGNSLYLNGDSENPFLIATVDGTINAVVQDTVNAVIYIAGTFTTVNGVTGFNNIAGITTTSWYPPSNIDFTINNCDGGLSTDVFAITGLAIVYNKLIAYVSYANEISFYNAEKYDGGVWSKISTTDLSRPVVKIVGNQTIFPLMYIACGAENQNDQAIPMLYTRAINTSGPFVMVELPEINRVADTNDLRGAYLSDMVISDNGQVIIIAGAFVQHTETNLLSFNTGTFDILEKQFIIDGPIKQIKLDRYGHLYLAGDFRVLSNIGTLPVTVNGFIKINDAFGTQNINDIDINFFINENYNGLNTSEEFGNGCIKNFKIEMIDDGENLLVYSNLLDFTGKKPYEENGNFSYSHDTLNVLNLCFINTNDLKPLGIKNNTTYEPYSIIGKLQQVIPA